MGQRVVARVKTPGFKLCVSSLDSRLLYHPSVIPFARSSTEIEIQDRFTYMNAWLSSVWVYRTLDTFEAPDRRRRARTRCTVQRGCALKTHRPLRAGQMDRNCCLMLHVTGASSGFATSNFSETWMKNCTASAKSPTSPPRMVWI